VKRITASLPDPVHARLLAEAKRSRTDAAETLADIVEEYFQMIDDLEEGNVLMKPPED
jgi:hypothetical protein